MDKALWRRKKNKSSRYKTYWREANYWDKEPLYEHEAWVRYHTKSACKHMYFKYIPPLAIPGLPLKPKRKRHNENLDEFRWFGRCPKYWNKLHHIRPVRRKWKRWLQLAGQLNYESVDDCEHQEWRGETSIWDHYSNLKPCLYTECIQALEHISEGMPYPSHKMHIYYY